eukprot:6201524-Pleurochrysis_carterae.AAC.2
MHKQSNRVEQVRWGATLQHEFVSMRSRTGLMTRSEAPSQTHAFHSHQLDALTRIRSDQGVDPHCKCTLWSRPRKWT